MQVPSQSHAVYFFMWERLFQEKETSKNIGELADKGYGLVCENIQLNRSVCYTSVCLPPGNYFFLLQLRV